MSEYSDPHMIHVDVENGDVVVLNESLSLHPEVAAERNRAISALSSIMLHTPDSTAGEDGMRERPEHVHMAESDAMPEKLKDTYLRMWHFATDIDAQCVKVAEARARAVDSRLVILTSDIDSDSDSRLLTFQARRYTICLSWVELV